MWGMSRMARVVASGYPHHVTQRGNRRQPTFFSDDDYRAYLSLMAEWCGRCGVEVSRFGDGAPGALNCHRHRVFRGRSVLRIIQPLSLVSPAEKVGMSKDSESEDIGGRREGIRSDRRDLPTAGRRLCYEEKTTRITPVPRFGQEF